MSQPKFVYALLAAFSTAGCAPISAGPAVNSEPGGNAVAQPQVGICDGSTGTADLRDAPSIDAGETAGCWDKGGAEHVYVLPENGSSGGAGYAVMLEAETEARICIGFHDQDRNALKWAGGCNGADGAPFEAWVGVAPESTAYVKVSTVYAPGPVPYRFTVDVVDVDEPDNSSRESATPITIGEPQSGYSQFLLNSDAMHDDWYKVDIAQAGTYEVLIQDAATQARMFVEAYDRDKKKVWSADVRDYGANLRAEWKPKRGTYHLKVADYIGAHVRSRMAGGKDKLTDSFTRPYTIVISKK